jgi:hypothetical protein
MTKKPVLDEFSVLMKELEKTTDKHGELFCTVQISFLWSGQLQQKISSLMLLVLNGVADSSMQS